MIISYDYISQNVQKEKTISNLLFSSVPVRFKNCLCIKNVHIINNKKLTIPTNKFYDSIPNFSVYFLDKYLLWTSLSLL